MQNYIYFVEVRNFALEKNTLQSMIHEMMFRTVVDIPVWKQPITLGDRHVFLGSCFADYIGNRFIEYGLSGTVNPVGVLFNPMSIYGVIQQSLLPDELPLFRDGERWSCWLTGTNVSEMSQEACRQVVSDCFLSLGRSLRDATHVFLTLGTCVCYRLKSSGLIVSNCHKQPQSLFEEYEMSLSECETVLAKTVACLTEVNPTVRVHFTVSPYRYAKYGFHRSQLAKATLLLAVEHVCREYASNCDYFPAYELVLDDLRDYRFFDTDMLHPNIVAVDYIWQRLVESCMDEVVPEYLRDYEPIRRAQKHVPLHPDSPQYRSFVDKIHLQNEMIKKKYAINNV